jgi:hypothetical protein
MKKLIICSIYLLFVFGVNAQIKFGLKGGVNFSTIKMDEIIKITTNTEEYSLEGLSERTLGFHGGLMLRVTFFGAFVQPELLFTSTGGEVTITDIYDYNPGKPHEWTEKLEFNKLDIPVLVGYKFGPVRLQLGPVASIIIDSKADIFDKSGYEEKYKNATFGYQAGLGIDILKKITFDFRFEGNMSKLGDTISIGGEDFNFDTRPSQLILSLGIFF